MESQESCLFRTPTTGIIRPISHEQHGSGAFNSPPELRQKMAYDGNSLTVAEAYNCVTNNAMVCVSYRLPRVYRGCTVYFEADLCNVGGHQGLQHIQVGYRRSHRGANIPFYDNAEMTVGRVWTRFVKEFTIYKPVAEIYFILTNKSNTKSSIRPRHIHIDSHV